LAENSIISLATWLQTPAGSYVRAWEHQRLDELTADIFGFNATQIGLPQIQALRANRMPHKWMTDIHMPDAVPDGALDGANGNGHDKGYDNEAHPLVVVDDFEDLPFASASIDLIVLPHVLEFAAEPHQVLREVERVLIPEGQVIICGFNPASLWGARQILGRLSDAYFLPEAGDFISPPRLKDWLKLLNMEVDDGHFGCYAPPCESEKWLQRYAFMEKSGQRWWPFLGAVYIVQAIKRVKGMHLVGPALRADKAALRRGVPAANKMHKQKK
jgi:SAM-dependent methyltransferase